MPSLRQPFLPALLIALALLIAPSSANSQDAATLQAEIKALRAKLAAMEKRVAALESIRPTFTGFMPDFAERFHVMHLSGEAGDWAVASHELMEMNRLMKVAKIIDAQKGQLMEGFLGASLRALNAAIEHGNHKSFDKALKQTIVNCNKCHQAVGSGFIKASLKVEHGMSMRHAHALKGSKASGMPMHKH